MKKNIELINDDNVTISPIVKPYKPRPYTINQVEELAKCAKSIHYFCNYVQVVDPVQGLIQFNPYAYQKKLLVKFSRYRFNIVLSSRQSGKTTIVSLYALWRAMFQKNQYIGIVSNVYESAVDFLNRIKTVYENLPDFLKPGVVTYNQKSILFDNGSKIHVAATTPNAFRGRSLSLLIFDEMAAVDPPSIVNELWASLYPTVSKGGNIIIISTPMGVGNLFYELWTDAIYHRNNFHATRVDWWEVPGRDDEWKEKMIRDIKLVRWNREYGLNFLGSTTTVIEPKIIDRIQKSLPPEDNITKIGVLGNKGELRIFEKPEEFSKYIIGVDVSRGVGQDYSVAQVFKIIDKNESDLSQSIINQVAVFDSNMISPKNFAKIVYLLGEKYNNAFIAVENNSEGCQVVDILWNDLEYENLINWRPRGQRKFQPGIRSTKVTKNLAINYWKTGTEENKIHYFDYATVKEISCFVEENGKCRGKGSHDDKVAATYWAAWTWEMYKREIISYLYDESMEAKEKERDVATGRKIRIMKQQNNDIENEQDDEFLQKVLKERSNILKDHDFKSIVNMISSDENNDDNLDFQGEEDETLPIIFDEEEEDDDFNGEKYTSEYGIDWGNFK